MLTTFLRRLAAVSLCAALLVSAFPCVLAGQAAQSPAAPPPGSAGTFKSAQELAEVLNKAGATTGGMTTSAVSNTDQYRVNIVHRARPAGALAHAGNTALHYIIEGSGTMVTGGTIVKGPGGANSPHWYSVVDGAITYLEVRWLAPAK